MRTHLQGIVGKEPLSRAAYVPFYLNKVKDQQEMQATHTYNLIKGKIFMEAKKLKKKEDCRYEMIISRELLPCVLFCLLST